MSIQLPDRRTLSELGEANAAKTAPADSLNSLGLVLSSQGTYEQAEQAFRRVVGIWEQALGGQHPYLTYALVGLAKIALAQRHFDTARAHAQRAVTIRQSNDVPAEELAEARFILAKSLWPTLSERPRVRTLAEQAREGFAEAGEGARIELDEVEQWLKTHRVR